MHFSLRRFTTLALIALTASAAVPHAARADAPGAPQISGVRSWSAPTSTRIVLDFTRPVTPVLPDSGFTNALVLSVPENGLTIGEGVPSMLRVRDSVVDSVRVTLTGDGARVQLWFADTTNFRAFTLVPDADKPFRLVVDVSRPGAEVAIERKLAAIATGKKIKKLRVIAVDPGHGGEDTGARGPGGVLEKSVTLAVAKQLVDALNRIPGIQGQLTRSGDYFIPLRERYRLAERMKADLFISVHCNSSRRRGHGSGTEVYFLSLHGASDQADADLADMENAADMVGGVPSQSEDALVNILYDVKRSSALEKSQLLAEALLDNIAADRLESRGVKQAGFAVLKSVEFPSVLVETAFINNPIEVRLLKSPDFQRKMGQQLAEGVEAYFERAGIELQGASRDTGAPGQH